MVPTSLPARPASATRATDGAVPASCLLLHTARATRRLWTRLAIVFFERGEVAATRRCLASAKRAHLELQQLGGAL